MPPKPARSSSEPSADVEKEDADAELDEASESEDDEVVTNRGLLNPAGGIVEEADEKFERELEDELEEVCDVLSKPSDGKLIQVISRLKRVNSLSNARYQDILPQVIDGRKFIIDGDSLLMLALDSKGYSMENGGQTLHLIYLVEKFLMSFLSRHLNCVIVFFEVWDHCWKPFPDWNIARAALKLHFLHNQKQISVLNMRSLWAEDFFNLIDDLKPSFILMAQHLPDLLPATLGPDKTATNWMQFILSAQSLYCEFLCLDVVDMGTVHSTTVSLMATVHVHINNFQNMKEDVLREISSMEEKMPTEEKTPNYDEFPESGIRSSTFILSAAAVLKRNSSKDVMTVVKTVILSAAILEFIPLKMRCIKNTLTLPLPVVQILKDFQSELAIVLSGVSPDSSFIDFRMAADLWHGRFIQSVFNCVAEAGVIVCGDLGNIIASRYEELVEHVNKKTDTVKLLPYPIEHICEGPCVGHALEKVSPMATDKFKSKIIPTSCKLAELFSGKLTSEKEVYSSCSVKESDEDFLDENRLSFSEKPLLDEYELIPDQDAKDAQKEVNKRYAQSGRNRLARFYTIYGLNLEGRSSVKAIVSNSNSNRPIESQKKQLDKPKSQAKGKLSKKEKIIEDNIKRIQEDKLKQIKERLKSFTSNFSSLVLKGDFNAAIEKCDIELHRASEFSEIVLEILFLKAKACLGLWTEACYSKLPTKDYTGAKDLFLVIREIFKIVEENKLPLGSKQKTSLSTWLHELGFKDLCAIRGLPEPTKSVKGDLAVGMDYVEFQLTQLGADLNRETGGKPDPRADGFIPDPWQVDLFNIIDKNQSAVVVAPTSSGKTYASYYCMEQVIRSSDDGVVVYVCPTKALVNQVYATIYARFKKNLPPGKTLLGICTKEFRHNVTNCQILTTVPECMELMLLSPKLQSWVKRIKYVIFDEVHCLVAQSGGLCWENSILLNRSPFLALSATIHKPEEFCGWLQKVEDFKRLQAEKFGLKDRRFDSYKVSLVVHSERHNHLIKSVMMDDGSVQHVHPYSFLSPGTSSEFKGIPKHISLSPDEALELFVVMKKELESEEVDNLCLKKYFHDLCPSGYLSMQSVQKFSELLREILNKESENNLIKVLEKLRTVDYSIIDTSDRFVLSNVSDVLNSVKDRSLMPALVFSYNRSLVEALPMRLLRYLRNIDDFTEDEETDIESESETESGKKTGVKTNRRFKGKRYKRKIGLMRGPSILKSTGSLRGEGFTDEKVIEFIEHRLIVMGYKAQDSFPSLLRRGLARHHEGMNSRERSAVEMLFRLKVLNFVSATGTLAMGIHMPCKTVVVAGDSPYLNVLEFNQMSGRAGRRGFDKEGNVIFYGVHKRKLKALMTGNLPQMVGNFPLSASLILRLLLLVADASIDSKSPQEATNEALTRAYTLLEGSLLYEFQPHLQDKMKYYFSFVVQFLIRQNLLGKDGKPHVNATFMTHLHDHEPGNFAFYFLLNSGILEEMCKCDKDGNVREESLLELVTVLNFLFGRLPLSQHLLHRRVKISSLVVLPPLPEKVILVLEQYNKEVLSTFSHYFLCVATDLKEKFGDETNLPLSQLNVQPEKVLPSEVLEEGKLQPALGSLCSSSNVCSSFAGLSGNTDDELFPSSGELLHIRDDVTVKIVPTLELDFPCNSYALDFYKYGNADAIRYENGLRSGHDFNLLKDFSTVLKCIQISLTEMLNPDAKLLKAIGQISETFSGNLIKAYWGYKGL
ncbi:probable ATP-dependent RNA helicase DDX60 isoform X2 [Thrips palmi]|nr:probable ATP-dependent RNA helicase DDX60 isoform X2 [Thrips palmi]